jgi:hypothetical protein
MKMEIMLLRAKKINEAIPCEHAFQRSQQGSEPAESHALQCTQQRLLSSAL